MIICLSEYTSWSILRAHAPPFYSLSDSGRDRGLLLVVAELLNIDSVLHLESLQYRRLVVLLTSTELLYNACLLELSLELLECSFEVFTVFYWYNNHLFCCFVWLYIFAASMPPLIMQSCGGPS